MLKKIVVLFLALLLLVPTISTFAQQTNLTVYFETETVTRGDDINLIISADGTVSSVSFKIYVDNPILTPDTTGMQYSFREGYYYTTFDPSQGDYVINCSTYNYIGDATFTIYDVVLNGSQNIGNVTASVKIEPVYTEIYTKEDLNNIRNDLDGNYILMNDIIFTEEDFLEGGQFYNDGFGWRPIGAVNNEAFVGIFNGNGKKIVGLKITKAYYNNCGLFGINKGTVKNLIMEDADIDATYGINMSAPLTQRNVNRTASARINYEDKDVWTEPDDSITEESLNGYDRTGLSTAFTGIVAGINTGTIENVYAGGKAKGNTYVGGITGKNNMYIYSCAADCRIESDAFAGGIAGNTSGFSIINDVYAEGSVKGDTVGGIVAVGRNEIKRAYCIAVLEGESVNARTIGEKGKVLTANECYGINGNEDNLSSAVTEEGLADLRFTSQAWTYEERPYLTYFKDKIGFVLAGDVNNDGEVDINDLAILKIALADSKEDALYKGADVNIDGNIDITDLAVLKIALADK